MASWLTGWIKGLITPLLAFGAGWFKGIKDSENSRLKKANKILRRQIDNNITSIDDARKLHKHIRDKHSS